MAEPELSTATPLEDYALVGRNGAIVAPEGEVRETDDARPVTA